MFIDANINIDTDYTQIMSSVHTRIPFYPQVGDTLFLSDEQHEELMTNLLSNITNKYVENPMYIINGYSDYLYGHLSEYQNKDLPTVADKKLFLKKLKKHKDCLSFLDAIYVVSVAYYFGDETIEILLSKHKP